MPLNSFLPWSRRKRLTRPGDLLAALARHQFALTLRPFTWRGGCATSFCPCLTRRHFLKFIAGADQLAALASDGGRASMWACITSHMIARRQQPLGAFGKEFLRVVFGLDNRLRQQLGLVVKQIVVGIEAGEAG